MIYQSLVHYTETLTQRTSLWLGQTDYHFWGPFHEEIEVAGPKRSGDHRHSLQTR